MVLGGSLGDPWGLLAAIEKRHFYCISNIGADLHHAWEALGAPWDVLGQPLGVSSSSLEVPQGVPGNLGGVVGGPWKVPGGSLGPGPREAQWGARCGPKWAGSRGGRTPEEKGGSQARGKNKNPLSRPGPMARQIFTNGSFPLRANDLASCCARCLCHSVRLSTSPPPIIVSPRSRPFVGFVRHWNLRCDGIDNRSVASRCRLYS